MAVLVASLRRGARALRASEARARHLAFHDALTGLPNRASFNDRLAAVCAARKPGAWLLLLDLDRFKQVNDTFGHPVGDALLCAVADRLDQVVRLVVRTAMVARLGGDEFALVLPQATDEEVEQLCRAITDAVRTPFALQGARVELGVSIGAARLDKADSLEALVRTADKALYGAKRSDRGAGLDHRLAA